MSDYFPTHKGKTREGKTYYGGLVLEKDGFFIYTGALVIQDVVTDQGTFALEMPEKYWVASFRVNTQLEDCNGEVLWDGDKVDARTEERPNTFSGQVAFMGGGWVVYHEASGAKFPIGELARIARKETTRPYPELEVSF